jgi:hypothetical protein
VFPPSLPLPSELDFLNALTSSSLSFQWPSGGAGPFVHSRTADDAANASDVSTGTGNADADGAWNRPAAWTSTAKCGTTAVLTDPAAPHHLSDVVRSNTRSPAMVTNLDVRPKRLSRSTSIG